ncbi:MAG: ATP-binding protein [Gemmatimonadales bacterium]
MGDYTTVAPPGKLRPLVLSLGVFALAGGLVSFVGWLANVPRLADWFNNGIAIQPNATIAVACAGTALILIALGNRRFVPALGIIIGLSGASALFQYISGINLPALNTLFLFDRSWGRVGVVAPGRMGPPGAFCWTVIGTALVLLSGVTASKARRFVPPLALASLAIALLGITGYMYQASTFYSKPHLTVIALQTAIFIAAVSTGLIATVPEFGPAHLLSDDGPTGVIARRGTPLIIGVAFLIGLLRLAGEQAGLFDLATGTALRTVVEIALLLGLLSWSLVTMRRHDRVERESRRKIEEADRRKDEFLATLGHELRGPLAPLRNTLEIMKRVGGQGTLQEQARETMARQLGQLVRLVDDLIDVSRITHDKIELRREPVELSAILHQALEACQPLAAKGNIRVRVYVPPDPILLYADPVRLVQVFGNLLNNAYKYTDTSGQVWVGAECVDNEAIVTVRDTGVGIPRDQLERIFELFTQIDVPLERAPGGLGIGLTLVKRLVEMHGGSVTAQSEGLGRGSEFVVRLPLVTERGVGEPAAPRGQAVRVNRRILVVDDNADAASTLAALLAMTGNETHTAHDGEEAVRAAERLRPDVVLLDIGLPKLNGLDVCRRIRQQPWGREMMVVAVTGLGQEADRRKSAEAGFDSHLVKPVDYDSLLTLLADQPPLRD